MTRRKGIDRNTLLQSRLDVIAPMWMPPWAFGQPQVGAGQLPPPMMGMMPMPMHPQQMMSMAGMMGMPSQPQSGVFVAREQQPQGISLSTNVSGNIEILTAAGHRTPMVDDPRKLSTSYKSMGLVWMHGE